MQVDWPLSPNPAIRDAKLWRAACVSEFAEDRFEAGFVAGGEEAGVFDPAVVAHAAGEGAGLRLAG